MKLIDQCSEYLKSKFDGSHILDFGRNNVLPYEKYSNFIFHTQWVVSMFGTI